MFRYKLSTLLIVLAVGPPVLAPVLMFLWEWPQVVLGLFVAFAFAVFWLSCGMLWLKVVQIFEQYSKDSK
jgi:hypothetical protein